MRNYGVLGTTTTANMCFSIYQVLARSANYKQMWSTSGRLIHFAFDFPLKRDIWPIICNSRNMSSQKTIINFFKPVNKRNSVENEEGSSIKKLKTFDGKENIKDEANKDMMPGSPGNATENCLSPDQKKRMTDNKLKAEIKLQSKRTPALHENIGMSWYCALKQEFSKPYFDELSKFVVSKRSQATVYPPADQVFSWTHHCALEDIRVVILGQDPYHGVGQAHGLCFSVQKGIQSPPSLLNMYKELESDIPGFTRPSHGHLIGWAKQGVLLLNACLTVTAHQANSHKDKGWEKFTDAVIKAISQNNRGVVFLLWGSYAQKKAAAVDKKKHHLLSSAHPSPLSAHRGFLGNKHFSKCNELLIKEGKKPIDWNDLPLEL